MTGTVDVLLVEDNPADAEFVMDSLRRADIAAVVHHVHDGVEALDFLFARGGYAARELEPQPRLVLLDIKLPKVDGFSVLREIKGNQVTRLIPVVMLTSSIVERDVAQCYHLGVNSYVQKPMGFEQFRSVVQDVGRYWLDLNATPRTSISRTETSSGAPT